MNITGGIYNRQKITAPDESITRPTLSKVRMSVFNTLAAIINFNDKSFLDMYAGSGIMGLEAISRGFKKITSIEKNKKVYNITKQNFAKYTQNNDITLIFGDSLKICKKLEEKFDVIYIDPPYFSGIYEASLSSIKNIAGGIVILEHITEIELPENFVIIKQKKYADKYITFLEYNKSQE